MASSPGPTRVVPTFGWSAPTRWTLERRSFAVLVSGLALFGVGDALIILSRLGNTPWSVLAEGISEHTGLGIGIVTVMTSLAVLTLWIPIGERPGIGTIANTIIIGTVVELMVDFLPNARQPIVQVSLVVVGIAFVAVGGGLYLSTHLGPGPRDGWMTGLARKLGRPIAHVRISIEVLVLVAGWAMGGRLGVGTVAFALTIGHGYSLMLGWLTARFMPAAG